MPRTLALVIRAFDALGVARRSSWVRVPLHIPCERAANKNTDLDRRQKPM